MKRFAGPPMLDGYAAEAMKGRILVPNRNKDLKATIPARRPKEQSGSSMYPEFMATVDTCKDDSTAIQFLAEHIRKEGSWQGGILVFSSDDLGIFQQEGVELREGGSPTAGMITIPCVIKDYGKGVLIIGNTPEGMKYGILINEREIIAKLKIFNQPVKEIRRGVSAVAQVESSENASYNTVLSQMFQFDLSKLGALLSTLSSTEGQGGIRQFRILADRLNFPSLLRLKDEHLKKMISLGKNALVDARRAKIDKYRDLGERPSASNLNLEKIKLCYQILVAIYKKKAEDARSQGR